MGRKPELVLNKSSKLSLSFRPTNFLIINYYYLLNDQEVSSVISTVMGNAPLGSYLGYQLFDSKKSLSVNVDRSVEKMIENQGTRIEPFPDLPIQTNCTFPNS